MAENKSKTKTEMLLELESIKGLLREEDDIPILQEMVVQAPKIQPSHSVPHVEQQDFFSKPTTTDSATHLLDTLSDLANLADAVTANKTSASSNNLVKTKTGSSRTETVKAAGENPFLPQHIRTRLHGNNPPPLFEIETARKIVGSSRPTTFLGNTQHSVTKNTNHQRELIDDIVEIMLPEMTKELRQRLTAMSKEMLEILLAEHK